MKLSLLFANIFLIISPECGTALFGEKVRTFYNNVAARFECAKLPDDRTCAVLFDEDDCSGWQMNIKEGYTELPKQGFTDFLGGGLIDRAKKNDAEAVLVRDGCIFIGYDHYKDSFTTGLGDAIAIMAIDGNAYKNFAEEKSMKHMDEKISAVDCFCKGFAFSKI
eukprot:GFUD01014346.1.p1 GENE.GFUD01014346.1~~GFUD01014346.1.p1  ORF type:complete len:165 (+),score=33.19 GFUD01014346.1:16-510(+)